MLLEFTDVALTSYAGLRVRGWLWRRGDGPRVLIGLLVAGGCFNFKIETVVVQRTPARKRTVLVRLHGTLQLRLRNNPDTRGT